MGLFGQVCAWPHGLLITIAKGAGGDGRCRMNLCMHRLLITISKGGGGDGGGDVYGGRFRMNLWMH